MASGALHAVSLSGDSNVTVPIGRLCRGIAHRFRLFAAAAGAFGMRHGSLAKRFVVQGCLPFVLSTRYPLRLRMS
jgi:hypothetical protein